MWRIKKCCYTFTTCVQSKKILYETVLQKENNFILPIHFGLERKNLLFFQTASDERAGLRVFY